MAAGHRSEAVSALDLFGGCVEIRDGNENVIEFHVRQASELRAEPTPSLSIRPLRST
jgi:hypothetical protein